MDPNNTCSWPQKGGKPITVTEQIHGDPTTLLERDCLLAFVCRKGRYTLEYVFQGKTTRLFPLKI